MGVWRGRLGSPHRGSRGVRCPLGRVSTFLLPGGHDIRFIESHIKIIRAFSITARMTDRGTCWSITINNPTEEDLKPSFPNCKWVMKGQMERGEEGTEHYQGMLTTPQVRFTQVKKALPRAHIELAKNKLALERYVSKSETRIQAVSDISNNIPTLFDYQHTIASRWDDAEFDDVVQKFDKINDSGELALIYVDSLVEKDIESGMCGIEYIAINPMWRSAWKRFWKAMVLRERSADRQTDKTDSEIPSDKSSDT